MKTKRNGYSIVRLISTSIQLLYLATVFLSLFYFTYFTKSNYSKSLEYYKQVALDAVKTISFNIDSTIKQLESIVYEASNTPIWFTESPYEHMLYAKTLEDSLAGSLSMSTIADAMIILPRRSDFILETHIMDDVVFNEFLDKYNRYNTVFPEISYFGIEDDIHLVLSRPIRQWYSKTRLTQTVGTLYVTIPIRNLLNETILDGQQMIGSMNNGSLRIFASTVEDPQLFAPDLATYIHGTRTGVISHNNHTIIVNPIEGTELLSLVFVPDNALYLLTWRMGLIGVAALLLLALIAIGGIKFLNNRIRHPINSLIEEVQGIQSYSNEYRLKKSESYEITEISESINHLLDELEKRNDLILKTRENLRELHLLHRESQLLVLQAQINPHFLYNTLECIRSIAQSYNAQEISDILQPMIQIYRYSASRSHMGTIDSEIACVKNYAQIIETRFDSRIRVEISCDPSVGDVAIPRMVLQPIVENAVNHGYENTLDEVVISVQTGREETAVLISVTDWGVGMTEMECAALVKRLSVEKLAEGDETSIGLRNVHQRIKREFGEKYGVSIASASGKGTTVTVRIPLSTEART